MIGIDSADLNHCFLATMKARLIFSLIAIISFPEIGIRAEPLQFKTNIPRVKSESMGLQGVRRSYVELGMVPDTLKDSIVRNALLKSLEEFSIQLTAPSSGVRALVPPLGEVWEAGPESLKVSDLHAYNRVTDLARQLDPRRGWALEFLIQVEKKDDAYVFSSSPAIREGRMAAALVPISHDVDYEYFHNRLYKRFLTELAK